jgi:DNA polymerase III epsilon subunit-like protein
MAPLIVAIDTETTGLGPNDPSGPREDGIVQVGIAFRLPGKEVTIWTRLCNPGLRFLASGRAERALVINHLSKSEVLDAPASRVVATELLNRLNRLSDSNAGIELRAFNSSFDRPFLEAHPWGLKYRWGPCLMLEAMDRYSLTRRPRLVDALSIAGVRWTGPLHEAGADAHAALLLHEAMSHP